MRNDPPDSDARPPARAGVAYRAAVAALVVLLIAGAAALLLRAVHTLLLAFAGVLFALFLGALADGVHRRTGVRRGWALAAVVLALALALAAAGWFLAGSLAAQFRALSDQLPEGVDRLRGALAGHAWGRLLLDRAPQAAASAAAEAGDPARLSGVVSGVSGFLVAGVVVLFVGLFVAAEPHLYRAGALHLVPPPHRRRAAEALDAVGYNLRWWLVGQAALMAAMAATTTTGLWLIGVPMALALGLIAGLCELVPYVGPWLSAVPAALVALLVSPWHLGMVLGLYLGLHVLEGYVLVPLIQRRAVRLPPAVTLVAQLLGAEVLGVLGLFVAAPLAVVAVVALKMLYVEDTLGDRTVDVPGEPGAGGGRDPGAGG